MLHFGLVMSLVFLSADASHDAGIVSSDVTAPQT
jgi:hypothetical protein